MEPRGRHAGHRDGDRVARLPWDAASDGQRRRVLDPRTSLPLRLLLRRDRRTSGQGARGHTPDRATGAPQRPGEDGAPGRADPGLAGVASRSRRRRKRRRHRTTKRRTRSVYRQPARPGRWPAAAVDRVRHTPPPAGGSGSDRAAAARQPEPAVVGGGPNVDGAANDVGGDAGPGRSHHRGPGRAGGNPGGGPVSGRGGTGRRDRSRRWRGR